jgi:hypothetical protein
MSCAAGDGRVALTPLSRAIDRLTASRLMLQRLQRRTAGAPLTQAELRAALETIDQELIDLGNSLTDLAASAIRHPS